MSPILKGVVASQISGHLTSPAMEWIATATGTGSSGTISFTGIPSTYKHLQLVGLAQDTTGSTGTGDSGIVIRFNNDSGSNYSYHGGTGGLGAASTTSVISKVTTSATFMDGWYTGAAWTNSGGYSGVVTSYYLVNINDYASTSKFKTMDWQFGYEANSSSTNQGVGYFTGNYKSTSAVNRVDFILSSTNFSTKSHFALYGIKG
jgi:hypothetical protein